MFCVIMEGDTFLIMNPLGGALPPLGKSIYSRWRPRWLLSYTKTRFLGRVRSLKKMGKILHKRPPFQLIQRLKISSKNRFLLKSGFDRHCFKTDSLPLISNAILQFLCPHL